MHKGVGALRDKQTAGSSQSFDGKIIGDFPVTFTAKNNGKSAGAPGGAPFLGGAAGGRHGAPPRYWGLHRKAPRGGRSAKTSPPPPPVLGLEPPESP